MERIPFRRAMGQPELPSSGGVGAGDEGEGSEVEESPNSWIIGLSVRVLCGRLGLGKVSVGGDRGSGVGGVGLGLTETSEIGDSTTGRGRTCCMT